MGHKIITLSGAATDVLYALFFRGALLSGDLPSKSGTAELRELGFAETRHTATEYQKENHFTFLTSEGQKFAVEHLVNTRFGEQQYCASMTLGVEIDTSAAQRQSTSWTSAFVTPSPSNLFAMECHSSRTPLSQMVLSTQRQSKHLSR